MEDNREFENGSNFDPNNYTSANICSTCGAWVFKEYEHICNFEEFRNEEEEWNRYIYSLL